MGEHPISNRLAADQPTWGADRSRSLADQADPATDEVLLPQLDDGIVPFDVGGDRGVPTLQSLVLDYLLLHDGLTFWVDANGHATTTTFSQIAPSQRSLNRIHVVRGSTAYQHYDAVCDLSSAVDKATQISTTDTGMTGWGEPSHDEDTSSHTPALIVASTVDAQYRVDNTLGETHAKTLQARIPTRLATYTEGYNILVLVTRNERNEFTEPVATVADHHLKCEQTRMGPRVIGEDFETLVYPVDDGAYYQTTLACRRQLLAACVMQVSVEPTTPTSSMPIPEGAGTGITANGETAMTTTDLLLDAWTATGTGGR